MDFLSAWAWRCGLLVGHLLNLHNAFQREGFWLVVWGHSRHGREVVAAGTQAAARILSGFRKQTVMNAVERPWRREEDSGLCIASTGKPSLASAFTDHTRALCCRSSWQQLFHTPTWVLLKVESSPQDCSLRRQGWWLPYQHQRTSLWWWTNGWMLEKYYSHS